MSENPFRNLPSVARLLETPLSARGSRDDIRTSALRRAARDEVEALRSQARGR